MGVAEGSLEVRPVDAEPIVPSITTEQMRQVDRLMVEAFGIGVLQMMEAAGRNLAELARMLLGGSALMKSVAIAVGKGNNGGGGMVAARYLSNWGANVTLLSDADVELAGVPQLQWNILTKLHAQRRQGPEAMRFLDEGRADLVIDALIGYGLIGPPRGWIARLIERINTLSVPVLSLDVPAGLDATTGDAPGPCIKASATMTLALPKVGLLKPQAKHYVGTLYLADIGVPEAVYKHLGLAVGPIFGRESIIHLA